MTTTHAGQATAQGRVIRLTLDYPPSANRYFRMVNGRMVRSREANAYKEAAGWICRTAGLTPLDGDVAVTLRFFRPAKRGDTDNLIKVTLDSMIGYAYHDDKQIAEIHATRHDTEPHAARVEIQITPIGA